MRSFWPLLVLLVFSSVAAAQIALPQIARAAEEKYGIRFIVDDPPAHSHKTIRFKPLAKADEPALLVYLRLFLEEFNKYPPPFVRAAGLKNLVFVKEITNDGLKVGAVPDYKNHLVFYDPFLGQHDDMYKQHVVHHEFFHLADHEMQAGVYKTDPYWASLNRPDFRYGDGGRTARTSDQFGVTNREAGFVNRYSTSALEEDRAEIFASMWIPTEARLLEQRARSDAILHGKIQRMRTQFEYYSNEPKEGAQQSARELFAALRSENVATVARLLDQDPSLNKAKDWLGRTPLHWAAMTGDIDATRALLTHNADPNAADDDGWTPLHVSAFRGDVSLCRVLLDAGADPQLRDKRKLTASQWANAREHGEFVRMLRPAPSSQKR